MKRVAVMLDGEVVVHMDGHGSYDTLCGLDGDDPDIGLEPAEVPLNGHARINCSDCWTIWWESRKYQMRDFADSVKGRRG